MLYKENPKTPQDQPAPVPSEPARAVEPAKPSAKPLDDEIVEQLREAAKRRRPWGPLTWVLAVLLIGAPAALLTWLLWPRNYPPELVVIGYDAVTCVGKETTLRAATQPLHATGDDVRWGNVNIYFREALPGGDSHGKSHKVRSKDTGIAELAWKAADQPGVLSIDVLYVDETPYRHWYDQAQLRVFNWPKETRILAVDVSALRKAADWTEMAKALQDAANAGWQMVYLALNADTPREYSKIRNWIMEQMGLVEEALPSGPVLGRVPPEASRAKSTAREGVLRSLKADFTGEASYLDLSDEGLTLRSVAARGELASGAIPVAGWRELGEALRK